MLIPIIAGVVIFLIILMIVYFRKPAETSKFVGSLGRSGNLSQCLYGDEKNPVNICNYV